MKRKIEKRNIWGGGGGVSGVGAVFKKRASSPHAYEQSLTSFRRRFGEMSSYFPFRFLNRIVSELVGFGACSRSMNFRRCFTGTED